MKNNLKKIILVTSSLLAVLSLGISLSGFRQINTLIRIIEERLEELQYFYTDFSKIFEKELKKNMPDEIPTQTLEKAQEIHQENNKELKERSLIFSPDGTKKAYFKNKFVLDIEDIGNSDYVSLIVEKHNGESETVFQDNFHVGWFEWLNNKEIKVYKSCGSACLLSYVVDIDTKVTKEFVE